MQKVRKGRHARRVEETDEQYEARIKKLKEGRRKWNADYRRKHLGTVRRRAVEWRQRNLKSLAEYAKEYKNRPDVKERRRKRDKARIRENPQYALTRRLRTRLNRALRGQSRTAPTLELLGCDLPFLIKHIESQFQKGMTWENRHRWHVDHIRPCASFDMSDPAQQRQCFHYTNLQPLWAIDNSRKHSKYEP